MRKANKRKMANAVTMIGLIAVIMIAGYFSADGIRYLIPSYKNDIVAMEDRDFSQRMVYNQDSDQLTLFPWDYYDEEMSYPASMQEKQEFAERGLNEALNLMLDHREGEVDYTESMVRGEEYPAYFIHNFQVQPDVDQEPMVIDCAFFNNNMIYYHQAPKERQPAHREQLEKAYKELSKCIDDYKALISSDTDERKASDSSTSLSEETNKLLEYLTKVSAALSIYSQDDYYMLPDSYLFPEYDFLYEGIPTSDILIEIYTMDQELLLIFPVSNDWQKYSMILFFDPMLLEFCGFSIHS